MLVLIKDFLFKRKQCVKVNFSFSCHSDIISGVPQGSVLGPLLFLVYINDVTKTPGGRTNIELFADDSKLHLSSLYLSDRSHMQSSLNYFNIWSQKWQLDIAPNKSAVLSFNTPYESQYTINSVVISNHNQFKDLGIVFDKSFLFSGHIFECCKSAYATINNLFRCFVLSDISILTKAYLIYARPRLEYCTTVWNPGLRARTFNGLCDRIEKVQRNFTRRLFRRCKLEEMNYYDRLKLLKLNTLELRRLHYDLIMVYKLSHGMCNVDSTLIIGNLLSKKNTRGHSFQINCPLAHSNIVNNYLTNRISQIWNSLDATIVNAESLCIFKSRIAKLDFSKHLRCKP